MINQNAQYADILRKRQEAQRMRDQGAHYSGLGAAVAGNTTVGGGSVQGMNGMAQATPQHVDWGSIIQGGVGNYMGAKLNKQANQSEDEADQMSQMFMEQSLKEDPEALELFQMAQMGMPGADQALADKINPKKEAMGAFLQHLQSGMADPAMARELAPRYGLSPDMAENAAKMALQRQQQAQQQEHDLRMQEIQARNARPAARNGQLSFQEFQALSPEDQQAYKEFMGNRNSTGNALTPGERQQRAKIMTQLDEQINKNHIQMAKFDNLRERLNNPEVFGPRQKIAGVLTESDNPVLGAIGTQMRSEEFMLLEDYLNSETLSRMAQLGGNDSNEELRRMRASLPTVMNDQKAALALMDQLDRWQRRNQEILNNKRREVQTGEYYSLDADPVNFATQEPVVPSPTPAAGEFSQGEVPPMLRPMPPKTGGRIKILSIE